MSSRPRRRRRRRERYAGVWRGGQGSTQTGEQTAVQHGSRGEGFTRWRLVSFMIVVLLSVLLALFFMADVFYVRSVSVGGLQYLTKEEVFAYADVANVHLFWIDTDAVRQNVLRSPSVADARVTIGWPPHLIQIVVDEREPALVWEQDGVAQWVDLQGRMMAQQEERPDLIRVLAGVGALDGPLSAYEALSEGIVHGALQLQQLLPQGTVLRYDREKGLGYKNINGWDVWFGTGTDMEVKVLVYQALAENLRQRGIQPGEINVSNPDAPYYNVLWGR